MMAEISYGEASVRADESGNASVTLTLNNNGTVVFSGLNEGAHYRITEAASEGRIASYSITDAVQTVLAANANSAANTALSTELETVDEGEDATVGFVNTKPRTIPLPTTGSSGILYLAAAAAAFAAAGTLAGRKRRKKKD